MSGWRAVVVAVPALTFLVTACGGGPAHKGVASLDNGTTTTTRSGAGSSSGGQSGATEAQLLKYAGCMRSHAIRDFPDPVPSPLGGYDFHVHINPGSDLDPNSPRYQAAEKACQTDVPPSVANVTPAEMAANALKWSKCMRAHGEPDFPDPNGQGLIRITNPTGIMDPSSPQFRRAEKACEKLGSSEFDLQITPSSGGTGGSRSGN